MKSSIRHITLVVFAVFSSAICLAQSKVVDRSDRKAPTWLDKAETDYIITSAIMPSMEQAKERCMENIRAKVIESVAQNVSVESQSKIEQTTGTGDSKFSDTFTSQVKTRAATLPFVRGISISKVTDSYWEKLEDKATGKITYLYAVRYPFPSIELKKLVREFERQDADMVSKLEALEFQIDSVGSVEQIGRAVSDCEPLLAYFFDDVRRSRTQAIQKAYLKLYDNIVLQKIEQKKNETRLAVLLNGRRITTSQRPQIKAACATGVECVPQGDELVVRYSTENCDEDVASSITLTFRIGSRNISHTIEFTPSDMTIAITPTGTMMITIAEKELKIDMDIKVEHTNSVTIESLQFDIPQIAETIYTEGINQTLSGSKTHRLRLNIEQEVTQQQNDSLKVARGTLTAVSAEDERISVPFILPYKIIKK